MTHPLDSAIRRRADGSIDTDFYARRAGRFRNTARLEALERLTFGLRDLWRRAGCRGSRFRSGAEAAGSKRPA